MTHDRREEFKYEEWQQGFLLLTSTTSRWTPEERQVANAREKRCAFVFFSSRDEGRGRELVFEFDSANECAYEVDRHNVGLWRMDEAVLEELRQAARPKPVELEFGKWVWW